MSGGFGIDPQKDAAGVIGNECFLCGKEIVGKPAFFGIESEFMPQLPCHKDCVYIDPLGGGVSPQVIREYHRRVADLVNAKRLV